MHKYAIQITVMTQETERVVSSTLKEASSWGKVDVKEEQNGICRSYFRLTFDC